MTQKEIEKQPSNRIKNLTMSSTFWIVIFSALTISTVLYSTYKGRYLTLYYPPLVDAAMEIKIETAVSHLWLEEIISGDNPVSVDVIWARIAKAQWLATAMLEGAKYKPFDISPIVEKNIRDEVVKTQTDLKAFEVIARKRMGEISSSTIGSNIDQKFDAVFNTFLARATKVELDLKLQAKQELALFHSIQIALLFTLVVITVLAFWIFRRLEKAQIINKNQREELLTKLEDQNSELERFNYTVSHDLKSPLITIQGFVDLIKEDSKTENEAMMEKYLDRISDATSKMSDLLKDLLSLSRHGNAKITVDDASMAEIVEEALSLVDGQIKKRNVKITAANDFPAIRCDRTRFVEVIQNLIDNSIKYMGDQSDPAVEIGHRRNGEETVFFVKDNGIGIPTQYHKKVFDLFEQASPSKDGTGIGLAIVKRVVENHGGRIWIKSNEDAGTSFCFTIPT